MFTKDSEIPDMTKIPRKQAPDTIISGCIVLEGGGFRGMYTSGVLDCLMEQGINFSCTVGVSAGALNGLNYAAGQIGRSARFNLQYRWDSRYVGVQAYRANHGIIGFDFVLDEYNRFDPLNAEVFYRQDRRFVAVATSCLTGKAEYFEKGKCRELMKAVQASASIPYVSRPVEVEGVPCLDGGCADRVPFQWAVDQGYEKILVVRTRTRDFRAEPNPRASHVAKRFYWRYLEFSQVLAETDEIYNRQCDRMEELEAQGRIFYLTPSEAPDVKVLEKDLGKLLSLYQLGYRDAQAQLPALRAYLGLSEGEKP